jgi:hypothetical protein
LYRVGSVSHASRTEITLQTTNSRKLLGPIWIVFQIPLFSSTLPCITYIPCSSSDTCLVSPGPGTFFRTSRPDQMERSIAMLLLVFLPLVASSSMSPDSAYTSAEARNVHRTYQVRLAALSCSCISLTTSLLAFYWFCRMDKLFRHRWVTPDMMSHCILLIKSRLIMLLVYGDLTRATAYFVFAVVSQARGNVRTERLSVS